MDHPFFIAILRLSGNERSSVHEYAIYYVNNSDTDLNHLTIDSGAFVTADDDPVTMSSRHKNFDTLDARSYRLIEYEGFRDGCHFMDSVNHFSKRNIMR